MKQQPKSTLKHIVGKYGITPAVPTHPRELWNGACIVGIGLNRYARSEWSTLHLLIQEAFRELDVHR